MESVELETLIVDVDDRGVVTVTMNRPQRKNAATMTTWRELRETFVAVSEDPTVRVVVLTGAGGDFCSGADVSGDGNPDEPERHQLQAMHVVNLAAAALHALTVPVIAKVDGVAVGAGLNMALACDLIVASDRARFSEIFARRGLTVDFGGTYVLPRAIGLHRAKELALFADVIDAAEADRIGLVNRVVPVDELDAFVDEWAGRLADGPPLALAMTKRMLNAGAASGSLPAALDMEGMAQTVTFSTKDTAEAMAAFIEKRDPVFRGR